VKLSEYAKSISVTYRTAWSHFKNGQIEGAYQLPSGTIVVPDKILPEDKGVAIYARVSSSQNKSNLKTQVERLRAYCAAKGYRVVRTSLEVGSGINDQRPKLISLLEDDTISLIVVEHKDRLTRFGFNYIQCLLETQDRGVEVINEVEDGRDDLMQDLISIITSFVARYYGRRRSRRKTEKIIKVLEEKES